MEELRKYILECALANGVLCDPGAEGIATAKSIDDLLEMYIKYIDYSLEHNFPSNKDLLRIAGDYLPGYGIHIDKGFGQINSRFSVLLGACKASLMYSGYAVAQVFVKHQSTADLVLKDNVFVVLDCFDNSIVSVVAEGNSKITINMYGNAKITKSGNGTIKIIHKLKDTY